MAVSRPVLLALLGAFLLVALFYATVGARESSEQSRPAPAPGAEKPAPEEPAKTGARALISRVAAYGGVTGGVGVSRAPAIVILGGKGSARVIEGFVDRETLAQEVTDTR